MEPIVEAPLSHMEESSGTDTTSRLLEMMTEEAGSSDEECDDDDDSGILDRAALMSLDDTGSSRQYNSKNSHNKHRHGHRQTKPSHKNLKVQPAAPSHITQCKKNHKDKKLKSIHHLTIHRDHPPNSKNSLIPAHLLQQQQQKTSTMTKKTNQSFPVSTLKTPLSKSHHPSSSHYHHRTTGNVTGICPLPSPPPHDHTVAMVSPLSTNTTTSAAVLNDNDATTSLLPLPSSHSSSSAGMMSTTDDDNSSTENGGAGIMESSPTSVMTPVGMTSISDMSTIAPNGTSVHVVNDMDDDDRTSSPVGSHKSATSVEAYFEQRKKRHRRRHHLADQGSDDDDDNNDKVTPEDLLKRLSQDPLLPSGITGVGGPVTSLTTTATSGSSSKSISGHHLHHHHGPLFGVGGSFYDEELNNNGGEGLISKRLQEIECKKVALHQKRISLEQRLYDFVDSEKRMRVMIGTNPMMMNSSFMMDNSSLMLGGANSPRPDLSPGNRSNTTSTNMSLLQLPTPLSPQQRHHQQQQQQQFAMSPTFQNGDEMVQDYEWTDPRTKTVAYRYSGPLNTLKQPHGWGTMQFLDGQVYQGQIYAGYRWGMGTNRWPDGQIYVGEWDDHSRNGRGTHTWPDGRRVNGQWRGGHLNGRVIFSWPNGASFDGECRMGKKHGRGTHTWANGKLYNGSFVDGKEEGFGSLTQGDWKYRGQFKAGKREGYGMQLWRNKTYDGEWSNNKAHGKGRIVWPNGATYTGEFKMGKYHGLGVYLWPSGKKYVGSWEDGCKHGQGIYTWPSGKKFDGAYKQGLKDGYGRMTWHDGRMYCGSWKKGRREGRGIQTNADGSMDHCGLWKKDKPYIKGEGSAPSNSMCSTSFASGASLSNSARLRYQDAGGQNTSDEDIVFMESQSVAVADESHNTGRLSSAKAVAPVTTTNREAEDLPTHSTSMALSPEVKTIPATPSKLDDVSSMGDSEHDEAPNSFPETPLERISL